MKARPILFSAPMVKALIDGRKTQTRRVLNPQPSALPLPPDMPDALNTSFRAYVWNENKPAPVNLHLHCPYGSPGDLIWVRETFAITRDTLDYETGSEAASWAWDQEMYGDPRKYLKGEPRGGIKSTVYFRADGEDANPSELYPCLGMNDKVLSKAEINWKPSIFMPRWASRLTLRIVSVRVERLNKISEQDAIAEGIEVDSCGHAIRPDDDVNWGGAVGAFCELWESINGQGSWEKNPYVWCISFEVIKQNVDQVIASMEKAS